MQHSLRPSIRSALVAIGALAATVSFGVMGVAQNDAPPPPKSPFPTPPKGVTSAHYYKNIKVLKKLPADQMIPTMHTISVSLVVRCDFCHVRAGFERDDKPEKNVARQMILMTQDINAHQKILEKKATCYMCHHGRPTPDTQPPPLPPPPPPPGGGAR